MASHSGIAPAIPPSSPALAPPPSSSSPPPAASLPPASQPNATADPPSSSSPPSAVPGSPPPAVPPPTVIPAPSSPPPTSPPPSASPPPIISPPPPSEPPPPASPPPVESPPPPSIAPPPSSPPLPSLPAPSPPIIVPSPPVAPPPPPDMVPPPPPASPAVPTPAAPLPPTSPPPPSAAPPPRSPPPALPAPPPPTVVPSPPTRSPPSPVMSPPPAPAKPPAPIRSRSAPPPPAEPSPLTPPPAGSPPPSNSQIPPIPSSSPPSRNNSEPIPSVSPPGKSPSDPPPSTRSPPRNPTPSRPPLPSPTGNSSVPGVQVTPAPPDGPNSSTGSNSTPGAGLDINSSGGGGIKTGTAVGIAVAVSLVVLALAGIVLWSANKRKKQASGFAGGHVMPSPFGSSRMSESSPRSPAPLIKNSSGCHAFQHSPSDPGLGHSKPWFTYEELSMVTNGFSSQNLLGEGGFGCVYKGRLADGTEVAVKQLKVDSGQGEREFRAEVEIISRIHHRHLVSLVGYCISENQRLLVYDYVPNNTLHYHLHGEGRPVMDWGTRLKVALGAARGLAYLHEDCHPRIIHRDIKSSNILLDNNFEALVSDFGLAKLAMDANTHVTTRVVGTFGYLAPEYASSGKLTSKSDVFSFGVVLLELVTGRKPVDPSQPLGDESLVEWARPLMTHALETGEFEDLPDPRLEKNYNQTEMFRMIEVAAACVRHSAAMRPHMGQVVRALDGLGDSTDLHNGVRPGQSELFYSAQHSAEIRLFQRMAFGSQDYSSEFSQTSWSRREL